MLAYLNGEYLPYAETSIRPWDYGFTMGVTVTEFIRTFGGKLPLLDRHLARLSNGLNIVGIESVSLDEIRSVIEKLVSSNRQAIAATSDLAIRICVTPGAAGPATPSGLDRRSTPTVLIHANELSFDWATCYRHGICLCTVETREVSERTVSKQLKNRSRIHYYLAEREAQSKMPDSRALLLDLDGHLAEGTTASICIIKDGSMVAPGKASVLNSITFGYTRELASELGIPVYQQQISVEELMAADEVLWLSTPMGILPVTRVDEKTFGEPGPIYRQLIGAWSTGVGIDIVEQAKQVSTAG